MGRGAFPGTAAMTLAEAGDSAAGAQADAGALRQPDGDTAEEHVAGVRHCRSGPRLQRDADQRRDLSAARGVYDRGPDLLCDPVPGHACRAEVRAWPDLRQGLTRAWTDWHEAKFGLMPYHQLATGNGAANARKITSDPGGITMPLCNCGYNWFDRNA